MNTQNTNNETKIPQLGKIVVIGSALIAEFMEIKEVESSYDSSGTPVPIWYAGYLGYRTPAFGVPGKAIEHLLSQNKFNNSWDWIMPVIEKIEALPTNKEQGEQFQFSITGDGVAITKYDDGSGIIDQRVNEIGKSKFQSTFEVVVEFIKWWNAEKKLNMTKAQAQLAFVRGKKISHKYFIAGEFVKLNEDKKMIDETGLILDKQDFWLVRSNGDQFANGWSVIEG